MSIDVGCLIEQMVLQLPDNELKKRLSGAGLGKDEVEKIMERVSPELVDDSFRALIRTFREAVKRR